MRSIFHDDPFAGHTIIVTAGATGIGRASARELACLAAGVVLPSRDPGHLKLTRAEIAAAGGRRTALPSNIRAADGVAALFQRAAGIFGRIHGLVNSGGGQFLSPAEAITPKGWHAVVETHLPGTWYMSQAALEHGMRAHGGAI